MTHIPFLLLYDCQVTQMENDQMAPLFIVKVPCPYAQLQTVITFHYNSVGQTPTFTNGGGRKGKNYKTTSKDEYCNLNHHVIKFTTIMC